MSVSGSPPETAPIKTAHWNRGVISRTVNRPAPDMSIGPKLTTRRREGSRLSADQGEWPTVLGTTVHPPALPLRILGACYWTTVSSGAVTSEKCVALLESQM